MIQDEAVCCALILSGLEKFWTKDSVREWLCGPQVAKLLKSVAEQLVTLTSDEDTNSSLWNLIRAALVLTDKNPLGEGIKSFYLYV